MFVSSEAISFGINRFVGDDETKEEEETNVKSAFSPWAREENEAKDDKKTSTKPSIFSVTSLLANNDNRSSPSPSKKDQEETGQEDISTKPFFYPGLTLDMLTKHRQSSSGTSPPSPVNFIGRNAAAAALAAGMPPFHLNTLFPHTSAANFPNLSAMKSATSIIDANRNLLSAPQTPLVPLPFPFPLPLSHGQNHQMSQGSPPSSSSSSNSLELDVMRYRNNPLSSPHFQLGSPNGSEDFSGYSPNGGQESSGNFHCYI